MKLSIIILTILTAGSANAAALLECKSAAPAGPVEVKLFAQVPGGWHPVTVNTQSGYLNYAAVITGAADDFFGAKKQFKLYRGPAAHGTLLVKTRTFTNRAGQEIKSTSAELELGTFKANLHCNGGL